MRHAGQTRLSDHEQARAQGTWEFWIRDIGYGIGIGNGNGNGSFTREFDSLHFQDTV